MVRKYNFWSAVTCHRFVLRRLDAAIVDEPISLHFWLAQEYLGVHYKSSPLP